MTKTLLITGGGRGIGRATALMAAARGWSVAINYASNRAAADEVSARIRDSGGKAVLVQGDVSVENDVVSMFDAAQSALGALSGVVVNAGIVAGLSSLADMEPSRIRRMFDVNTIGAFLTAREAARRLGKKHGGQGGAIVFVSSIAARVAAPNVYLDYSSAKAAVDTLGVGLAKELGPEGVRVNVVRPGVIETDIHETSGGWERSRALAASGPLGRPGTADEVAETIVWLLSDAASFVTGSILDVGGGR